jgi:hypothetical protein
VQDKIQLGRVNQEFQVGFVVQYVDAKKGFVTETLKNSNE